MKMDRALSLFVTPIHTTTRLIVALALVVGCSDASEGGLPFLIGYDFEDDQTGGLDPNNAESWQVVDEEGSNVYKLQTPGEQGEVRAPTAWSLLADFPVSSFVFRGRLKSHADPDNLNRDICVFLHFQDPTHFYYVHFSASSDEFHNIIGLVNGADRVKVNRERAGESIFRLTDAGWHEFKVTYDADAAEIRAFLDDMDTPVVTASDTLFRSGLVGIGSFDDTGSFDNLSLWGEVVWP
jgi:hypothetical protein